MKKFLVGGMLILTLISTGIFAVSHDAEAVTRVRGYYRSNGTYVQPHYRSDRNYTRLDNWSTRGNYNPYNGKKGTRSPYTYYWNY